MDSKDKLGSVCPGVPGRTEREVAGTGHTFVPGASGTEGQARGLKSTEIYFLKVLEARSPGSRFLFLGLLEENLCHASPHEEPLPCRCITPISVFMFM